MAVVTASNTPHYLTLPQPRLQEQLWLLIACDGPSRNRQKRVLRDAWIVMCARLARRAGRARRSEDWSVRSFEPRPSTTGPRLSRTSYLACSQFARRAQASPITIAAEMFANHTG